MARFSTGLALAGTAALIGVLALSVPSAAQSISVPNIAPPRVSPPMIVPQPLRQTPERVRPEREAKPKIVRPARPRMDAAAKPKPRPKAPVQRAGRTPPPPPTVTAVPFVLPQPRPAIGIAAERPHEPDVVLISIAGLDADAQIQAIATGNQLTVLESRRSQLLGRSIYRLRVEGGRSVEAVLASLGGDARIAAALPNHIFVAQQAAGAGPQYAAAKLGLGEAHRVAQGTGIVVAVIDSGVDTRHETLRQARILAVSPSGAAVTGADHGTGIAGLIMASGSITGVAPAADMVAIEAFAPPRPGAPAETTTYRLLDALEIAFAEGARIINMSFAGPEDILVGETMEALHGRGVVMVAAAGNEGPRAVPAYPAAHARAIAVTAVDAADRIFSGANRGAHVAVAAPGVDVIAPAADNRYTIATGTSMAAAYITGAVALMLELRPDMAPDEVRAALVRSARDLGPSGHDRDYGAGLVDVAALIAASAPTQLAAPAGTRIEGAPR